MEEPSILAKKLIEFIDNKSLSLLEIGPGFGDDALFFAQHGFNVTILDSSINFINKTLNLINQNNLKIEVINSEIEPYEFKNSYNIIFSNLMIHFLAPESIPQVLEKIKRNTTNQGVNAISILSSRTEISLLEVYKDWEILYHSLSEGIESILAKKPEE